jgi:hypothetical protein
MSTIIQFKPDPQSFTPWFKRQGAKTLPKPTGVNIRQLYHYLVNVEEYPEVLPLAYDLVTARLDSAGGSGKDVWVWPATCGEAIDSFGTILDGLSASSLRFSRPWQAAGGSSRRKVLHYFMQYLPTALVDGCCLQGGVRSSTAHTVVGASLTSMYQHQVRALINGAERHFVGAYRDVYARLGSPLEELSSCSFVDRKDLLETSFDLPIFLLSIAQFTQSFCAEILGLNLAWQVLGLSEIGRNLIHDTCTSYALPMPGDDFEDPRRLESGYEVARTSAIHFLEGAEESAMAGSWEKLLRGLYAGFEVFTEWFDKTSEASPNGPQDPGREMIEMLRRKAPHAFGYHFEKTLGSNNKRIDEYLNPKTFDGPALLAALASSPWVSPGDPDRSALLKRLISFGGPMLSVFSPVEVQIIENWINSLPTEGPISSASQSGAEGLGAVGPPGCTSRRAARLVGHICTPVDFHRWSERVYRACTVRELYHYLINFEFYSDVLPIAERFARARLERSMARILKGERPIPSPSYDPLVLAEWVHAKHREQVESYRRLDERPDVPKRTFIETTVQLAPLVLIDGGWLQGVASPVLIHSTVGRMLFHVLVEELGQGNAREHHANIYRELLTAMGVKAPPVGSWEFAMWSRLSDSSFDVPAFWLSISCFPRHFLPEILGLNLAVELAGVGGPYMEARDTLRRFGYPSLFVDVHNSADNVSVGHAAWALNAINRYMDELAEREGPHNLDHAWYRVWSGVRVTLPQIGRIRLLAHRIRKRIFGWDSALTPRIFPS